MLGQEPGRVTPATLDRRLEERGRTAQAIGDRLSGRRPSTPPDYASVGHHEGAYTAGKIQQLPSPRRAQWAASVSANSDKTVEGVASVSGRIDSDAVYSRAPLLKVFVSSVMRGSLMADRAAAAAAVESTSMHSAWFWERDADAGPYCSKGICLGHARTADCLLLLIEDDLSTITRAEYLEAKHHHVPRFVFLRQGGTLTKPTERFIARERRTDIVYRRYSTTTELHASVVSALFRYAINSQRRDQVSRAQVDPAPQPLRTVS